MCPRTPYSPPELPTITRSMTTSGATVALSPARMSAKTRSHTGLPVAASSAIRCPLGVTKNTRPFATATPRLTLPQQSGTSNGTPWW